MPRLLLLLAATAALTAPACGQDADPADAAATTDAAEAPAPAAWRMDLSHLADDVAQLEGCFVSANQHNDANETPCIGTAYSICSVELDLQEAPTTGGARACNWREIAAWEEVLEAVLAELGAEIDGPELARLEESQAAWEAFMIANVRAKSERFSGGTLAAVVAGAERARMVAERAVELREFRRERRE